MAESTVVPAPEISNAPTPEMLLLTVVVPTALLRPRVPESTVMAPEPLMPPPNVTVPLPALVNFMAVLSTTALAIVWLPAWFLMSAVPP
jgi:hypothetical protein